MIRDWLLLAQKQVGDLPTLDKLIQFGQRAYLQTILFRFPEKQRLALQAKHKKGIDIGLWLDSRVEQRIERINQLLRAGMKEIHLARIEII